jgi:glucose-6-phosphate dehydrogenase assembly protein OpcA
VATPLAHQEEWSGEDVRLADVERALCELREASAHETEGPDMRTSVMTHLAWVPDEWHDAALETLEGLAERHPSRTILLFPAPEAPDGLDARAAVLAFPLPEARRHIATEVVEVTLRGRRGRAPASIVTPLLVADLPVFLRWRGRPPFGAPELEQLVEIADRLVVDSREWPDVSTAYRELVPVFDRVACSDIAWRRTLPIRRALAAEWPAIAEWQLVRVAASPAEASLLAGWLRSRLGREVEVLRDEDAELRVDGESPSELLSAELDELGRNAIYEDSVRAGASV